MTLLVKGFVCNGLSYLTGKVFSTNCMPSGSEDGWWSEDVELKRMMGSGGCKMQENPEVFG